MTGPIQATSVSVPQTYNQHRGAGGHTAAMPEKLAEFFIKACSPAGGVVLDPFAGFGTTILAARHLGRRAGGLEIHQEFVAAAHERCAITGPTTARSSSTSTPLLAGLALWLASRHWLALGALRAKLIVGGRVAREPDREHGRLSRRTALRTRSSSAAARPGARPPGLRNGTPPVAALPPFCAQSALVLELASGRLAIRPSGGLTANQICGMCNSCDPVPAGAMHDIRWG